MTGKGFVVRAVVTRKTGQSFEVSEVRIAEPIGQEVLVEVRASGLCHSDISVARTGMGGDWPMVLGHEIAGVVVAVGPSASRIKVGDHVVAAALRPCGQCSACLKGAVWSCSQPNALDRDSEDAPRLEDKHGPVGQMQGLGGFAEKALVHENQLVSIDPAMPFAQASIIGCAVATGGGVVLNVAKVQPGESVAVFGCGGVGLNAIQVAAMAGATRIIGVDIQPDKLELAKKFGATDVIDSTTGDTAEVIHQLTGSQGVQHAFVMVGVPQVTQTALQSLGQSGTVYLVGGMSPGSEVALRPSPGDSLLLPFQQGIRGTWLGSSNFYHDIPMYVDLYLQGRLNLDDLVSRTISIDDIDEAYEELERGSIARSVITFPAKS
ncbi:zinc-binding dehydrogenase (plasmid) [Rhodococcus erythropolis]|uniref:zinc-binding dehydrogenase n=1 Tax=Rhodococcus erythropolis TaxID=1833 RepID=UPI00406BA87E